MGHRRLREDGEGGGGQGEKKTGSGLVGASVCHSENRCVVVVFILLLSSLPGGGSCTLVCTRPVGNESGSLKNWVFLKDNNRYRIKTGWGQSKLWNHASLHSAEVRVTSGSVGQPQAKGVPPHTYLFTL